MTIEMQTFIEQRAAVKRQIYELENDNRRLQREIDSKEAEMDANRDELDKLHSTLHQIGQPVENEYCSKEPFCEG